MIHSRKPVALILCLMLALSLFGGALAEGAYPIAKNPGDVKLKIMVVAHPAIKDWNTNAMSKWMEEKTGVQVEWQTIPLEGRVEALQLTLAGGEYPDAFMLPYGNTINADVLNRYGVTEKRLAVLNDLIKEYMPNFQKALDDNPGYEDMLKMLDGNIYSLPGINQCYHCTVATKLWINHEWLKKLNLEMPTTIDEFYNVLVAFRDQDPNGNGLKDEIPLAGAFINGWNAMPEYFLMNSFVYYKNLVQSNQRDVNALGLYVDKDVVKTPFWEDGFKDGLRFMRKLVAENLLYDGAFTMDGDALINLVENPDAELVGVAAGGYGGIFSNMDGERYRHFSALMPLKGPTGLQQIPASTYDLGLAGIIIAADSPNKEAVARWADLLYTFEGTTNAYLGPEGKNWRRATEGELGINGKPALYTQLVPWQETEPQDDHWVQAGIDYRNGDWRLGMTYDQSTDLYSADGLEALLYQISVKMREYADPAMYMPPVKFSTEDSEAMAVNLVELGNLCKEYVPGFMSGAFDIDKDYDSFLEKLEGAGLKMVVEKYQAAYDQQFKK